MSTIPSHSLFMAASSQVARGETMTSTADAGLLLAQSTSVKNICKWVVFKWEHSLKMDEHGCV